MSGIYIPGMKMPSSCFECPCCNGENGYCQLRKEYVYGEVPRSCHLVHVPPHGRLIDVDALIDELPKNLGIRGLEYLNRNESAIVSWIRAAPVIIEAEVSE